VLWFNRHAFYIVSIGSFYSRPFGCINMQTGKCPVWVDCTSSRLMSLLTEWCHGNITLSCSYIVKLSGVSVVQRAHCCQWRAESTLLSVACIEHAVVSGVQRARCCQWRAESKLLSVVCREHTVVSGVQRGSCCQWPAVTVLF